MEKIIYALTIEVIGHFLVDLIKKINLKILVQKIKRNWSFIIQFLKNFLQ